MPKNLIDIDEQVIEFKDMKETVVSLDTAIKFPGTDEYKRPDELLTAPLVVPTKLELLNACPRCNKPLVAAMAISGNESVSFKECPECGTLINTFKPTAYQARFLQRRERYRMTAGGFGCTSPETYILMFDGSKKMAKDVGLGELLMGPDNTPRKVLEIHTGEDARYQVTLRGVSSPLYFNGGHILYLYNRDWTGLRKRGMHNYFGEYCTIPITEYVPKSKRFKASHYWLFTDGFEYDYKPVPVEPYLLGLLLGDGSLRKGSVLLTTEDIEIINVCKLYEEIYNVRVVLSGKKNHTYNVGFTTTNKRGGRQGGAHNDLLDLLRGLGLAGTHSQTKFIPNIYKQNSKDVRRKVLAGLIDTDGYQHLDTIDITLAGERLANDIKDVAQSLGIRANLRTRKIKTYPNNIYYRVTLSGPELNNLPVLLPRKRTHCHPNKSHTRQRFSVTKVSERAPFVGFTVDQDSLYVEAENYSIIHNSGKSRSDVEDVIKHVLLIPGARVCVAARTYPALEGTFVKEFYSMFPNKLVRRKNDQKHEISLTNGSEILFRSFDDETKLKSMNLTMAVIVEASDVEFGAFTMLQSRIRNTAAMLPELTPDGNPVMEYDASQHIYRPKHRVDARHINLETNPDSGWVKSKFLLDSHLVEFFGDAYNEAYRYNPNPDPHKYTQIVSTSANPYLPEGYEEEQTRGKSQAYIQQFYKGSFNFSSNLVFPNFGVCIVPPHPLPRAFNETGRRVLYFVIGADYGINDPTHFVFSAFSVETKKLYVFAEYRLNNSDIKTIARGYRKEIRINGTDLEGLLMLPKFDGKSYNKRESDLISIGGMFEAEGLRFEPAFASHESRIIKMNSLLNHNQIEIYSTCEFLIEEALNYKFKTDRLGAPTNQPQDGNDHGVTALEFSIVDLPHNLTEFHLNAYLPPGTKVVHDKFGNAIMKEGKQVYDPLAEDTNHAPRKLNALNNRIVVNDRTPASPHDYSFGSILGESLPDEEGEDAGPGPLRAFTPNH